ncbi:MAG: GlxA family transcriptional regulator [Pseudomonadota bacterium]
MTQPEYGFYQDGAERSVGFYLCDDFNMLPFMAALEPLRIANRRSREGLYQWRVITATGESVVASNGFLHRADMSIAEACELDMIMVAGPYFAKDFDHDPTLEWLAQQGKRNIVIGGLETGSHLLAAAGLLDGLQCTTHWESIGEFTELFPDHAVSSDVYEIDSNRITCSGGAAAMDMMLYVIEQHHGHELAATVADSMIHPNIRHHKEPQRMNLEARLGINHPDLLECIELMEANIEQPLTPNELADLVGVSKRQLERLFRRFLHTTPARYYLSLRLESARQLLEKSQMKIIDIAVACGFKSAGHFSSRYYSSFGITPRETRKG